MTTGGANDKLARGILTEDSLMRELSTGRLYVDGEPEVRIRHEAFQGCQLDNLLLVVTTMGDDAGPVGLTSSIFAAEAIDVTQAGTAAMEDVAERVAAVGGRVLHQEVRPLRQLPKDLTRFVVVDLLQSAKRLLPH